MVNLEFCVQIEIWHIIVAAVVAVYGVGFCVARYAKFFDAKEYSRNEDLRTMFFVFSPITLLGMLAFGIIMVPIKIFDILINYGTGKHTKDE